MLFKLTVTIVAVDILKFPNEMYMFYPLVIFESHEIMSFLINLLNIY